MFFILFFVLRRPLNEPQLTGQVVASVFPTRKPAILDPSFARAAHIFLSLSPLQDISRSIYLFWVPYWRRSTKKFFLIANSACRIQGADPQLTLTLLATGCHLALIHSLRALMFIRVCGNAAIPRRTLNLKVVEPCYTNSRTAFERRITHLALRTNAFICHSLTFELLFLFLIIFVFFVSYYSFFSKFCVSFLLSFHWIWIRRI